MSVCLSSALRIRRLSRLSRFCATAHRRRENQSRRLSEILNDDDSLGRVVVGAIYYTGKKKSRQGCQFGSKILCYISASGSVVSLTLHEKTPFLMMFSKLVCALLSLC